MSETNESIEAKQSAIDATTQETHPSSQTETTSNSAALKLSEDNFSRLNHLIDQAGMFSSIINTSLTAQTYALPASQKNDAKQDDGTDGKALKIRKSGEGEDQQAGEAENAPKSNKRQPSLVVGGTLRSYQLSGVNWLISLFENGINGILADEMGLGKTVVTIAFIAHLISKGLRGPFLVVAPLSTLGNWINEFEKWCPSIKVELYHGRPDERKALREKFAALKEKRKRRRKEQLPVLVTSFDVAIRDSSFLQKEQWRYLVVDEAHRLKNFNCKLIKELRQVPSMNRLLLTGTPLHNNLSELWSLLNFCLPDVFDNVQRFISWFDFLDNDDSQTNDTAANSEFIAKLHNVLRPFILRRLKSDVDLEIPKKTEVVLYAGFTEMQKVFYELIRRQKVQDRINMPRVNLNNLLMHLRKICNHPWLMNDAFEAFYMDWALPKRAQRRKLERELSDTRVEMELQQVAFETGHLLRDRRRNNVVYSEHVVDEAFNQVMTGLGEGRPVRGVPKNTQVPNMPFGALPVGFFDTEATNTDSPDKKKSTHTKTSVVVDNGEVKKYYVSHENLKEAFSLYCVDHADEGTREELTQKWSELSHFLHMVYANEVQKLENVDSLLDSLTDDEYVELLVQSCGKLNLLHRMLPQLLQAGHKVLLFSQMTRMLDVLEGYMNLTQVNYRRIDGNTSHTNRQQAIDEFNKMDDVKLFLLSTRAGGLGINLVSADTVIIYDSDWNPQMDLQAQDRAHRIGQTREVCVYRLVTSNSIESRILKTITAKLKLEALVINKGKFKTRKQTFFTESDLKDVLDLDVGNTHIGKEVPITEEQLKSVLHRPSVMKMGATVQTNGSDNTDAVDENLAHGFEVREVDTVTVY